MATAVDFVQDVAQQDVRAAVPVARRHTTGLYVTIGLLCGSAGVGFVVFLATLGISSALP